MIFNVNFRTSSILIKSAIFVCELYRYQNARYNDTKEPNIIFHNSIKKLCVQKAGMFSVRQKITFKKHIMEFQLKGVVNIYDAVNIFVLTETHLIIFQSKFHQTAPRGASNEKH